MSQTDERMDEELASTEVLLMSIERLLRQRSSDERNEMARAFLLASAMQVMDAIQGIRAAHRMRRGE